MTLPIRESPHDSTGSLSYDGQCASSHAKARSTSGDAPPSRATMSYQALVWATCRRRAVSPASRCSRNANRSVGRSMVCSAAIASTVASCSRRWSARSASYSQLPPNGYGRTSGGIDPSTRRITKNGAPSGAAPASHHSVSGTGAADSSLTSRTTSNCACMSYVGNTGTSAASGATLATSCSSCVAPSASGQVAENSTVSLDMPLASVPCTSLTRGVASGPSTVVSQVSKAARRVSGSRLLRRIAAPVSDVAVIPSRRSSQCRRHDARDLDRELLRAVVADVECPGEQRPEHHLEQRVDRPPRRPAVAREEALERLLHRLDGAGDQPLPHVRVGLVLAQQAGHSSAHRWLRKVG